MTSPTEGESQADRRRDQMLAAAAQLIPERGFADTRIIDVARRAGVSPALVIYYFGTKDQLLSEALRYSERLFDEHAVALLSMTASFRERLRTIVDLSCRPTPGQSHAWGLWLELWAQSLRRPEIAGSRRRLDDEWRSIIEAVVRDGIAAREVAEIDVSDFVLTFAALLDGLLIQVVLGDPLMDSDRASTIAMRFACNALGLTGDAIGPQSSG